MIHPAAGKWPRIRFKIHCHTCNKKITFSINYGQSTVWGNQNAAALARWASHDGHDVEVNYEFYDGREMSANG